MTTAEKQQFIQGVEAAWDGWNPAANNYIGTIGGVSRLSIPPLLFQDAQSGFRTFHSELVGSVTSFPCFLALGATWDAPLARTMGVAAGTEFKIKGANGLLGPSVDIAFFPTAGRNGESMSGEDGHLGGPLATAYIEGVQSQKVAAVLKHFAGNLQETNREQINMVIDERTLFEVHYPPFVGPIQAGTASIMCSYNKLNGPYTCNDDVTLNQHLKGLLGFGGFVMSDWWAFKNFNPSTGAYPPSQLSHVPTGLDMNMPGSNAGGAGTMINTGALPSTQLDGMVTRILASMMAVGAFDWETPACIPLAAGSFGTSGCPNRQYDAMATSRASVQVARTIASNGALLLKNDASMLPLSPGQSVVLLGSACDATPIQTMSTANTCGANGNCWYHGDYYVLGGSSRVVQNRANISSIYDGLRARGVSVTLAATDNNANTALAALASADVGIMCGGTTSGEFFDRRTPQWTWMYDFGVPAGGVSTLAVDQNDFLVALAAANAAAGAARKPLVAVTIASGAILTDFRDNVNAFVHLFQSGQETGNAVADVLYGDVNPSSKSPVTFPTSMTGVPLPCGPWDARAANPAAVPNPVGTYFDCSTANAATATTAWKGWIGQTVAYPFGFGLSYTAFSMAWSSVPTAGPDASALISFSVTVTNTGSRSGREVAQVYVTMPNYASIQEPQYLLRTYQKTDLLAPGASVILTFSLAHTDLAIWRPCRLATTAQQNADPPQCAPNEVGWYRVAGDFVVTVGASSRDSNAVSGTVTMTDSVWPPPAPPPAAAPSLPPLRPLWKF